MTQSADKKPEMYVGPDGKPKVRMVPVDREVVKSENSQLAKLKLINKIKRSGVVKTGSMSKNEAKDPEEYDKEGSMMKGQLRQICSANEKLMSMVKDDDNLPEWVQSKVTKATDYIRSVRDYLESEKMEESTKVSDVNEVSAKTLSNYMRKSTADAGNASVFDVRRQDKRIGGQKRADDKLRKMQGKGSAAKVAATESVNEAATPAMKKAADELNSYAKKSGGIDKADFMKTAKMLSTGKAGMALIKFVDGQDTEVYEKILTVMAKHMGKQTVEKMFKVKIREEVEQIDELTAAEKKLVNQMYDKKGNLTPMGKKVMNHGKKPGDKGYVESVNELSKDTMQSYWDKTKGDDAFSGSRKANNRLKGAINVTTKLDRLKKMVKK